MDDLISRQDVISAVLVSNFSACTVYGRSEEGMATAKELIQAIKNLPSAQPDRKKGEWLRKLSQTPWPICSECGIYGANESNYCPNCGADMRGDNNAPT